MNIFSAMLRFITQRNDRSLMLSYKKELSENNSELQNSKKWTLLDIPEKPFMEEEGIAILKKELSRARVFLEYGSGGSTVMASGYPGLRIHSIDSDAAFLSAVKERCILARPECHLSIHHAEIGPTSDWGVPSDPSKAKLWPSYCIKAWVELSNEEIKPDLILVDGRFRASCFLSSLALAPMGAVILFDDYANRKHYHAVERHAVPESMHGRMARFRKMKEPNISLLLPDILALCTEAD